MIINNVKNPNSVQQKRNLRKIYEGTLFKKGKVNRRWQNRWFVLYSTRKLAYYADRKESIAFKHLGEIDLGDVELINTQDRTKDDKGKDNKTKYVFEIKCSSRTYLLACNDMDSLNIWDKYLHQLVFGSNVHVGWLIKKAEKTNTWKKRWFTLSNLQELRYYEDETQRKFKGTINLYNASIIRHGDKEQYGYECTIEIITPNRTWVLDTTYHEVRELWLDKLAQTIVNENGIPRGIKMSVLYEGYLWKFEEDSGDDMVEWTKKYYGIDHKSLKLYFVQSYNKFKQFASTLFFDKDFYDQAVNQQLQGSLSIQHSTVEDYGNDDMRFMGTSQEQNPNIFQIANILGEFYFAADTETGLNDWIHHLGVAIHSGEFTVGFDENDNNNQQQQPNGGGGNMQNMNKQYGKFIDDPSDDEKSDDDDGKDDGGGFGAFSDIKIDDKPQLPVPPKRKPQPQSYAYAMYAQPKKPQKPKIEPQKVKTTEPEFAQFARDLAQKKLNQEKQNEPKKPPPFGNMYNGGNGVVPPPPQNTYSQQQNTYSQQKMLNNQQQNPYSQNSNQMPMMQQSSMKKQFSDTTSLNAINKQFNIQFSSKELELIAKWSVIIEPFIGHPERLENNAAWPCDMGDDDMNNNNGSSMHLKCQCVGRVSIILDYYTNHWMKSPQNRCLGMAYLLSILQDYSMTALFNDFFHLKRFHSEQVASNDKIDPLTQYFIFNFSACDMNQCVHLGRNNRNKSKCSDERILRAFYYIDKINKGGSKNKENDFHNNKKLIAEEICIQQILDMIHCYIYHGSYYSLYEYRIGQSEISQIRTNYANKKQNFKNNRYLTRLHKSHHPPYNPNNIATPHKNHNKNPLLDDDDAEGGFNNNNQQQQPSSFDSLGSKYNDASKLYEYTPSSFGIDMEHNIFEQSIQTYGPSKYKSFREEMIYRDKHAGSFLSDIQFNIIQLQSSILLSTFACKLLKSRRIHESNTFKLDPSLYSPLDSMTVEMCQSLLIYCNYNELRYELLSSYFKNHQTNNNNDCRHRHYSIFYNWGKLLYTAIIAFGTDIYEESSKANNSNKFNRKFYYHNLSRPVLFNKFNCSFFGPTSCTTSKNIALIHMPSDELDGIILELDTNNVGWTTPYNLNVSMFSCNPAENEELFIGGASLGIHNIISVYNLLNVSNLSNYTSAITLLRYIIGDTNISSSSSTTTTESSGMNQYANQDDNYDIIVVQILDEFDERVYKHLVMLIENQVFIYKNNRLPSVSDKVPLYMSLLLNSWCLNKQGIIQLNMKLLRQLPKPLQHKFIYESPENQNDFSINWVSVFNLFPNCNKIWKRGLYFNNYLCEQYVNFLMSENITNNKYKMDGIVFSCQQESDWKKWVQTAKKHSSIIKQMGWLITASPPKQNKYGAIETGRVSFIKRVNQK